MADEDKSTLRRLLFGSGHSERKDKVLEYIGHRLKDGAHLRDVVQEEYVQRNCTQAELDEIMADPKLVQHGRTGLEEYFDSGELNPKRDTAPAKDQSTEGDQIGESFPKPPETTPSQQRQSRSPS